MEWPYQFLELSKAQKAERQSTLDRYALYAQISGLLPILSMLLLRLTRNIFQKVTWKDLTYDTLPKSPDRRYQKKFSPLLSSRLREFIWWSRSEPSFIGKTGASWDQLIVGAIWLTWLLFLCINETKNDYAHISRRFGIIGTSQLPMQYLLATKRLNIIALAFRVSPKDINRWHGVLGRIIYFLVSAHVVLYLNYYIQVGGLLHAFLRPVPLLGMIGFFSMTILHATVLVAVKGFSYRLFFIVHVVVALAVPPLIWFHVPHGRLFVAESFLILLADRLSRKLYINECSAAVDNIHGTNLLKIVAKLPAKKLGQFTRSPASYVFLTIPWGSRATQSGIYPPSFGRGLLSNPFTVASVNEDAKELTLVVRHMKGPTTNTLAQLGSLNANISLHIEGPYSAALNLPGSSWSGFDNVLLIAGGIGATFILPLYEQLLSENNTADVDLLWTVRAVAETDWWPDLAAATRNRGGNKFRLFVTGSKITHNTTNIRDPESGCDDVELTQLEKLSMDHNQAIQVESWKRPDMRAVVDEFFQRDDQGRVAVAICGPVEMVRETRNAVGTWVGMGRNVWFRDESFGI
ncbi:metalloreductase Fre8 [Cadophora sp. MPI-SDFR-AT-0126]|nr:metalloreductase Fre8 [Leotiomycetes sp. MPI-SDFR-AT-0126]